jgi:hypothetical protein
VTETISPMPEQIDAQQLARQLVEQARADGVDLVGPGGLLTGLTKTVLETALDAELSEHLGYYRHDPTGRKRRQLSQRCLVGGQVPADQVHVEVGRDGLVDRDEELAELHGAVLGSVGLAMPRWTSNCRCQHRAW